MSDSVTVSTAEEPELTKDTNAQFSVSDTTNQDPQSTDYNTTPEVVEYQQAEEAKQSLEAYGDLLRAAAGGISRQTEAVMNVQLAQIDARLGQPAMGLEAFVANPRSALQPATVTLEAIQMREDALCRYLNDHPQSTHFHRRKVVSLEEAKEEIKQNGGLLKRFFAWIRGLIEKAKDWFSSKWDDLDAKIDEVMDQIKFTWEHALIEGNVDDQAWANGEYIGRTTDREEGLVNWVERQYLPWVEKVQGDAIKFLEGFNQEEHDDGTWAIEREVEEWQKRNAGPTPPKTVYGGGWYLFYNYETRLLARSVDRADKKDMEHMPKEAMSPQEMKTLLANVRNLIKRAKGILGEDPYQLYEDKEIPVNATGEAVQHLLSNLSPSYLYTDIWRRLYLSLHAKVKAAGWELSQVTKAQVNKAVDEANAFGKSSPKADDGTDA